jgi:hypothetical protein
MPVAWAPFFGDSELRVFLTLVEADVAERGVEYSLGQGRVELVWPGGDTETLGLANLAQLCARLPASEWPRIVAQHLDLVFSRAREEAELEADLADFSRVGAYLRVRLHDQADLESQVARSLAEGLVATLVYDLPSSMRSVHRSEAEAWGIADDALFTRALENLSTEEPPDAADLVGPEGTRVTVVQGASDYTASLALAPGSAVDLPGHPFGALVVVPARHVFFFHVIEDERVVPAAQALSALAREACRRGPGSISEEVFWLRGGRWTRIPCALEGGTLHVRPPASFMRDVLERVVGPRS